MANGEVQIESQVVNDAPIHKVLASVFTEQGKHTANIIVPENLCSPLFFSASGKQYIDQMYGAELRENTTTLVYNFLL